MPLPGHPDAVEEAARQLGAAAQEIGAGGESIAGHGRAITADWTGLAAPLALARTQQDSANVHRVAEAIDGSVGLLSRYAEELRAAQQDYARGESIVAQGRVAVSSLESAPAPPADAGRERAQQAMDDGAALMRAAQERARVGNEAAARALEALSSSLAGIAPPPSTPPAAAPSALAETGNFVASLGMAALEHPVDALAVAGGGLLAAAGITGALAGAALSLTGGGAVVGVPAGAASAAGATAGVGIAGLGLLDLVTHAATDSSVAPFQVDQRRIRTEGPAPFTPPSDITGMTKHGEEQAETRNGGHGVNDEAMQDAVENPVEEPWYDVARRTYTYEGHDAVVALNERGEVVTTWPRSSRGHRYP